MFYSFDILLQHSFKANQILTNEWQMNKQMTYAGKWWLKWLTLIVLTKHNHSMYQDLKSWVKFNEFLNPFSTNVPLANKPGNWFLLANCLKNTCGRTTL